MPPKSKNTLSQITISTTNIQGLGVGTTKGDRKCTTLLGLKTTITIGIDAHTDLHKISTLTSRLRRQLSKYDIIGHDSKLRGILVLTERSSGVNIENVTKLDNNILTFDVVLADQTVIHIISVYGPSADSPY